MRCLLKFCLTFLLVGAIGLGMPFAWAADEVSPQPSALDLYEQVGTLKEQAFEATNKGDFATAEGYWTQIIDRFPDNAAAWSNRGNARVSQNKLDSAIADFNKAMELAPSAPDPYLNRGAALEGLGQWNAAIADYNHVLELDP
ncbi:MAG: tetratricopeptide repeat protein, partial [Candidatus Parcubacteria bacterium]|nr:tetratricopeptide repeat protein [Leptolyngbyaceae cyanobacterium LF-bin-113]